MVSRFSSCQNWHMCCHRYLSGATDIAAGARTGGNAPTVKPKISDERSRKNPKGAIWVLVRNKKSYTTRIRRGKAKTLVGSSVLYRVKVLPNELVPFSLFPREHLSLVDAG